MNNEPVAELLINDGEPWGCRYSDEGTFFNADGSRMDGWIPLYIHPVKDKPHPKCDEACMYLCRMRELTDEEIMEIVADKYEKGHGRYIDTKLFFVEFAKAILRKAQERNERK